MPEEVAIPASTESVPEIAGAFRDPNTHAYISRIAQREENLFLEEYYSSTDVKIYFDDVEQLEIGYIQYSMQEQLKPLYGYASRTWDEVAIGNRIVTGILKVPIRNINARDYDEHDNPKASEFISYQGAKINELSENYKGDQIVWDDEVETGHQVPDWIDLSTSGGSVLSVLRMSEGYYQVGEYAQNLDVNHITDGIYNRIGYPMESPNDYPAHITDSDFEYVPETAEDALYRQKLQELGYNLVNGSSALTFKQQIMKFQDDMAVAGNPIGTGTRGILTTVIKRAIDRACDKKWAEDRRITIPQGTKLYMRPSNQVQSSITVPRDCEFVILTDNLPDNDGNIWKEVMSSDQGNSYYGYYCATLL